MEKQKGKAGYYVLSVVPLLATLMIQVLSGLTCSVIGTVVYSVRIAMNGEAELLNDPAALQAAVTDYICRRCGTDTDTDWSSGLVWYSG
jgi:hypothetical protein